MISILIGTKAQFIKVAPVLRELDKQKVAYRLIDSGQHKNITENLRKLFGIRQPDAYLASSFANIDSLPKAFAWTVRICAEALFSRNRFKKRIFGDTACGICLIHGDTLSTLLGLFVAKMCSMRVAHLEAGLRSFDIFNPFPEELIRVLCMKFSDYLFAPSEWAYANLQSMKLRGKIFNIKTNTVFDSIDFILGHSSALPQKNAGPYLVMSIHRFENIYHGKRLSFIVEFARKRAGCMKVIFILHQPTLKQLQRRNLLSKLNTKNILTYSLAGYADFISLIRDAEYIVADGGSIQEECYYLDLPCLIVRSKTERSYGIGQNACLSRFDEAIIDDFISRYKEFKRTDVIEDQKPSREIVAILKTLELKRTP